MSVRRLGSMDVTHRPLWQTQAVSAPAQEVDSSVEKRARQDELDAKERGYREGMGLGKAEGRKQAEKEGAALMERMEKEMRQSQAKLESSRERLDELFDNLSRSVDEHARHAEAVAVETAYAAIARFLGERYADRTLMESLCRHALGHAGHAVNAVRVSEQDVDALSNIDSVQIIGDSRLRSGQCALETRLGHYETGLDVRLDLIKQALLAGLEQHRSEAQSE